MSGQTPFEGAKNEKTPETNLMIADAGANGAAVPM
jgi:hypothetical protein